MAKYIMNPNKKLFQLILMAKVVNEISKKHDIFGIRKNEEQHYISAFIFLQDMVYYIVQIKKFQNFGSNLYGFS